MDVLVLQLAFVILPLLRASRLYAQLIILRGAAAATTLLYMNHLSEGQRSHPSC